jgi:hypothetical protein
MTILESLQKSRNYIDLKLKQISGSEKPTSDDWLCAVLFDSTVCG